VSIKEKLNGTNRESYNISMNPEGNKKIRVPLPLKNRVTIPMLPVIAVWIVHGFIPAIKTFIFIVILIWKITVYLKRKYGK